MARDFLLWAYPRAETYSHWMRYSVHRALPTIARGVADRGKPWRSCQTWRRNVTSKDSDGEAQWCSPDIGAGRVSEWPPNLVWLRRTNLTKCSRLGRRSAQHHFPSLLGGHIRMYLKRTRSSPPGNKALHLEQATLPWSQLPGESIVTISYFAPQLGQLNRIGSELCMLSRSSLQPPKMQKKPRHTGGVAGEAEV